MAIYLEATLPSGSVKGFHKLIKAEADFETQSLTAVVQSWVDRDEYLLGHKRPENTAVELPFSAFPDVEQALIENALCPFYGGTVQSENDATLEAAKARKNAQINSWRLAATYTSFEFAEKEIACDQLSRSDIDGVNGYVSLTGSLPPNFPNAWKAKDNTWVPIEDAEDWTSFYSAMVAKGTANFGHAMALKAALAAAETAEEVDAIEW